MKGRGKEDEKMGGGPMFPRLHVNDTEKGGGPRAPPRNKMALYEQLSVPSSRRFHHSNLAPPASSSSQASGVKKTSLFSSNFSHSVPAHQCEKLPAAHFGRGLLAQLEKKKKLQEEDDFTVPGFVQSGVDENHSKMANFPTRPGRAMESQNLTDCDPKLARASALGTSPNRREQSEQTKERASVSDFSTSSSTSSPAKENKARGSNKVHRFLNQNCRDQNVDKITRSEFSEVPLLQRPASGLLLHGTVHSVNAGKLSKDSEQRKMSFRRGDSVSTEVHTRLNKPENGSVCCINDTGASLQPENVDASALLQPGNDDQCHDISKTSVFDSVSVLDVSPDNVVNIIGQKHFWKARRLIVNQQKVFAVQVFELHRLIKVQQLIAEYPDVLLEGSINMPSKKNSPGKKVSSDHNVMPTSDLVKCDEDSQKSNQKIESCAVNAVVKTTPIRNNGDVARPHLANSPQVPLPTDPKLHPWSFQHPIGQQWLVPVMSPTEGLVYKPYTVPGLMGSDCRGFGNLGAPPLSGQTMNLPHGFPSPHDHQHHHHHGAGVPPETHHAYFSPHGLSVMNRAISGSPMEKRNHFTDHASNDRTSQLSLSGANFGLQQQISRDMPSQKRAIMRQVTKVRASKDADLLGSTASSPNRGGQELYTSRATEGGNGHYPAPMLSAASEGAQRQDTVRPTGVIKVVPHNRRSANESAARIFQSIQEERNQYESM